MRARGQAIAAETQHLTDAPPWRMAAAIAALVLVNLVAIAAFLVAAPRAQAAAPAARNVPALVTTGEMRSGALLLRSENDRYYAALAVSRAPSPAAFKFAAVATPRHGATLPKTVTDAQLRPWFGLALCLARLLLMVIRQHRRLNRSGLSTECL